MSPERRAVYRTARETLDKAISEREFMAQIIKLARLLEWRVSHPWLSIKSAAGVPDLLLVKPPRVIFFEVKTERGILTNAQVAWLRDLGACPGVEVYTARPSMWETVVRILEGG